MPFSCISHQNTVFSHDFSLLFKWLILSPILYCNYQSVNDPNTLIMQAQQALQNEHTKQNSKICIYNKLQCILYWNTFAAEIKKFAPINRG